MKLPEQATVREFAYRYLQCLDAEKAAGGKAGDGVALLSKPAVQDEIQRQRALFNRQMTREDTLRRLYGLVFGRCNDCVKLVTGEVTDLDALDLSLLSELKRSDKGGLEIKLLNRGELLRQLLDSAAEQTGGVMELLQAMQGEDD